MTSELEEDIWGSTEELECNNQIKDLFIRVLRKTIVKKVVDPYPSVIRKVRDND